MKRFIIVRDNTDGTHRWKNAPKNVGYLAQSHRHKFFYEVKVEVNHSDRDVEFFTLKNEINEFINEKFPIDEITKIHNFGERSCEMISEELGRYLIHKGYVIHSVYFYEDNIDGGGVEYDIL